MDGTMKSTITLFSFATLFLMGLTANAYESVHGGMKKSVQANYDSLYQNAVELKSSDAGQKLFDDCLAAYGGIEKLKQLTSHELHYSMPSMIEGGDTTLLTKSLSSGRQYRVTRTRGELVLDRYLESGRAWVVINDSLQDTGKLRLWSETYSYLVAAMPLAMTTESYQEVRYGTRDGNNFGYIYLKLNDILMLVMAIDPESHMIEQAEGIVRAADGNAVYINQFKDFRNTDGFIFPYSVTNISLGMTLGTAILDTVKINPEFGPGYFRPSDELLRERSR